MRRVDFYFRISPLETNDLIVNRIGKYYEGEGDKVIGLEKRKKNCYAMRINFFFLPTNTDFYLFRDIYIYIYDI